MFKSVFAKYLTAFILIILVCFSILSIILMGIAVNYSSSVKQDSVQQVAKVLSDYLSQKMNEAAQNGREPDIIAPANRGEIIRATRLAVASTDQLTVLVTDKAGGMVAIGGNHQTSISGDFQLPEAVLAKLKDGSTVDDLSLFGDTLEKAELVYAMPVYSGAGEMCGTVVVCSPSAKWTGLFDVMARTMVLASLWVMLAALIAVYFISERVSAPLKDMSRAVKDFAAGSFDRRVVVRGKDEIAELAIAFNQMAQSLENLEKMRNSFMANVSHDLRTPMTTIAGFIDGIREGIIPPEKQDYYLGIVSAEVHRLSRLVTSLLDVSRIQAGDRKFVMKPFDICEMGRQILISFEHPIEEKQLQIEFVCDQDNMMVNADHDAIYQVFYNICDNAVKFSRPEGKFRISICRRTDDGGKGGRKRIQVSVYNQGAGIPAEDIPFVFERFYKADKSRGMDKRGVGLGLYIAKTIINAHGGDIWVTSEEGKDCQFSFTLAEASVGLSLLHRGDDRIG